MKQIQRLLRGTVFYSVTYVGGWSPQYSYDFHIRGLEEPFGVSEFKPGSRTRRRMMQIIHSMEINNNISKVWLD